MKIAWDIHRVKKEFALGTVMWPVGAVRFWTFEEANDFRRAVADRMNLGVEATTNFFNEHFEVVWSSPTG